MQSPVFKVTIDAVIVSDNGLVLHLIRMTTKVSYGVLQGYVLGLILSLYIGLLYATLSRSMTFISTVLYKYVLIEASGLFDINTCPLLFKR